MMAADDEFRRRSPDDEYRRSDVYDRLERISDRVVKTEGAQQSHELVCAQRYSQILRELSELRTNLSNIAKIGLWISIVLFLLELGKATFPSLFDLIAKSLH